MTKEFIGIGDIVTASLRKIRGSERRFIDAVIVGENGNCWLVTDLKSKKGYTEAVPKKNCKLVEVA